MLEWCLELNNSAARVESELDAREAALIKAVRDRTAELRAESKALHQVRTCVVLPLCLFVGDPLFDRQRAKRCTSV